MSYTILIHQNVRKYIDGLDGTDKSRIVKFLYEKLAIADDPRSLSNYKPLVGSTECRFRVGAYRIVCEIEDETITVFVIRIDHRKKVYRR